MAQPSTIAIDGPAGSGKSAISERLAKQFGYVFLDTGAFYRAVTYIILKAEVSLDNSNTIQHIMETLELNISPSEDDGYCVVANGEDITYQLRSKAVEQAVSRVASLPIVRQSLLPLQRRVAEHGQIIMAGRDIGTVVLPDADLKLYIDASLAERAQRRYKQLLASGKKVDLSDIEAAMAQRDQSDSERSLSPLKQADDAIYIMTDGRSLEEVIQEITKIIGS